MSQKYKVKPGCRIEHNNQNFATGDVLELSPELALFHANNIEVVPAPLEREGFVAGKETEEETEEGA